MLLFGVQCNTNAYHTFLNHIRSTLKLFSYSKDTEIKYLHIIYLHKYTENSMVCYRVAAVCPSRRQRLTKKATEMKALTPGFLGDFPQL